MLSRAIRRVESRLTLGRKVSPTVQVERAGLGLARELQEGVCDDVQQLRELRHQPVGQRQDLEHAHEHHDAIAHGVVVKKPAHVDDMERAGGQAGVKKPERACRPSGSLWA